MLACRTGLSIKVNQHAPIVVIWVQNVHTELMFEIYSKDLVRADGKVLLMKLS